MSTFSFGANSGTDALAFNTFASPPAAGPQTILFDFDVIEVAIFGALSGQGTIIMEAFDVSSMLLGSRTISSNSYIEMVLGGIGNIRSLVINSNAFAWALDDLRFETAAVPEPTTLTLLGLGLAGLGYSRKRKNS